ncbi:MAG: VWA domain-containing protein [Roseitalea sp.]|uniref:VWA domain-containing protein n=1 Tax=Oceaniradius stylonematis TaxID=2184161 RepID=UPI001B04C8D9|nr:VWA domain-containing protein [Oceaniradius stylonematis]MBO6552323.1 VWA domain-containing protein [Roseitalea sp.]MBO6950757.1 VWA domain-containing protein [Rhizobiaceae bacterium]MBO6591256.1 VWA domain-containing protein [Roseitalea sp.]MBO6599111.1 VWA domain-containing protein [Roseitalea sp.]MBO6613521.1 VWA domain-containing protein [Roseitalea sp.]
MSKSPVRTDRSERSPEAKTSSSGDIAAFLNAARAVKPGEGGAGRIVLALDATMSRQPTWDMASAIQAEMFESVASSTALTMQLVYFRGFGECRASRWAQNGRELGTMMTRIDCRAGRTQIGKVLKHALKEHGKSPISALIYIGDAMEEDADALGHVAGQLGVRGVPAFIFQEGREPGAELVFREIARLTRGGWFRFDPSSPRVLADLLKSIAVYATGGLKALEARGTGSDKRLLTQLKGGASGR